MARFRRRGGLPAALGPGEQQTTIFDRLEIFPRLVEVHDPVRPAVKLLCAVLAMMGMGLLLQASHAATILPPKAFASEVVEQSVFRILGLAALLFAFRLGPDRVRRMLPVLVIAAGLMLLLVWVPGIGKPVLPQRSNGRSVRFFLTGRSTCSRKGVSHETSSMSHPTGRSRDLGRWWRGHLENAPSGFTAS